MLLNFTKFNESASFFSNMSADVDHSFFIKEVKEQFKNFGFTFKSAGKGSGSYIVNGLPMYFESRGSRIYALVFQNGSPNFPKDVYNKLEEFSSNKIVFFSVQDTVNFFKEHLPAYLSKKLIPLSKWGIL